jgi:hypothetical protein
MWRGDLVAIVRGRLTSFFTVDDSALFICGEQEDYISAEDFQDAMSFEGSVAMDCSHRYGAFGEVVGSLCEWIMGKPDDWGGWPDIEWTIETTKKGEAIRLPDTYVSQLSRNDLRAWCIERGIETPPFLQVGKTESPGKDRPKTGTPAMKITEEAYQKYWVDEYDPARLHKAEIIVDDIMKKYLVSKNVAEAIQKIIRPVEHNGVAPQKPI